MDKASNEAAPGVTTRLAQLFADVMWDGARILVAFLLIFFGAQVLNGALAIEPEGYSCPVADPVDGEQVERPAVFKKIASGLDAGSKA